MAFKSYNGWSGTIRDVRGRLQSQMQKQGKLWTATECELCHKEAGLTYHSEEYGSTYAAFVSTLHCLCPYCHGVLHVRFQFPNRFLRFKHRLKLHQFDQIAAFNSLGGFFGSIKSLNDIGPYKHHDSGIPWLDKVSLTAYDGPPKIALVDVQGLLYPDPAIYYSKSRPKGVWYDHVSDKLLPFE